MKNTLLVVLISTLFAANVFAAAPVGLKSTGLLGPNVHTHVTTHPSRIYSITMTPTSNSGWASVIETKGPRSVATDHISQDKVLADPQSATAGNTIHLDYGDEGVNCDKMFVDCRNALVEIYYKE